MDPILKVCDAVQDRRTFVQEKPSIDDWLLSALQQHGTQTLDQIGTLLPEANWAQVFLAIDRLSRSGKIALWSPGFGERLISANRAQPLTA
jgi:hypothetical protein